MSERTTIGGTVYESVGSSSSNLLLKCNGTARIQWGTKLIDLVKNGKIASYGNDLAISIVSDESEIKADGLYIIEKEKSTQLWICKNGNRYNITGTDLYISASTKQDITAEQKQQALENIGMYYNTIEDVKAANIKNGIVYVINDKTLYTINEGNISEFEAKLKTVTVEQEEIGEVINSSVKIVLSILDQEYLVLENQRITANYDVYVKDTAKLCSEGANEVRGYRLYMNGGYSYLDVDKLNVRTGLQIPEYIQTTCSEFRTNMYNKKLEPHRWYLITDYQNPWKIPENDYGNNRPILVRALTTSTIYKEGQLFKDRRVTIQYDPNYDDVIALIDSFGNPTGETTQARGRIVWMKDCFNNEANFDFLNYEDALDNPLTTLHKVYEDDSLDLSIFPEGSHDNKLIVYDLKGTVLKDTVFNNDNVTEILFNCVNMYNNKIECRGISVICDEFYNNTLKEVCKLQITENVINSNLSSVYSTSTNSEIPFTSKDNNLFIPVIISHLITNVTMLGCINSIVTDELTFSNFGIINKSVINYSIHNSTFIDIFNSTFNCQFSNTNFKSIFNCTFHNNASEDSVLKNITCFDTLDGYTTYPDNDLYTLLYDTSKIKEVRVKNDGTLEIISVQEQAFIRGMIIMHSGIGGIPTGWAICDGRTVKYDGVTSTTPDLRNQFIKASSEWSTGPVKNNDLNENNEFTLKREHLPEHTHPHKPHKHTFEGRDSDTDSVSVNTVTNASSCNAIVSVEGGVSGYSGDSVSLGYNTDSVSIDIHISGNTSEEYSQEDTQKWENKAFKIEPNYYSLIFIMKL